MPSQPKRFIAALRSLLPNAAWDVIKNAGVWAYNNPGTLAVIVGAISSGMAVLINRLRGLPPDLIGVLVVFGLAVIVALFGYVVGKLKNKKPTPAGQIDPRPVAESTSLPSGAHECPYEWVHGIADNQARGIRDFVMVTRAGAWKQRSNESAVPTIKWGLMIKNNSLFPISLIDVNGNVLFEGTELAERRFQSHNEVYDLRPGSEGSVNFEQRLSGPEAQLIKEFPNGKFSFIRLSVKVGSPESFPEVEPQSIDIGKEFDTTIDRISYKESEGMRSLRQERDQLIDELQKAKEADAELLETGKDSGDKNISERKALIESWRLAVSKAVQQYRKGEYGNYTFQVALEYQEAYMTLIPRLSVSAKTALDEDAGVSGILEILATEIARIEQEWGL